MGPTLVQTVRLLVQTLKMVAARALPGIPVQVGIHTSLDYREAIATPNAGEPAEVSFPYIALIGPTLSNEDERPIKIGYNLYRDKNIAAGTVVKQPFPQFKHLDFQIIIDAIDLAGADSCLPLVQAITAWAQEEPRVAGLLVDFMGEFNVTDAPESGNGELGDAVRAMGSLRLRSWRSYGGQPETVKIIKTMGMNIMQGPAPVTAWRPETSSVSTALRGAFCAADGSFLAVGDGGAVVRSSETAVWTFDDIGSVPDLASVWTSSAGDSWAVGAGGVVFHCVAGTWNQVDIGAGSTDLTFVYGTAPGRVFVCGAGGALFVFNGTTWTRLVSKVATTLRSLWGVPGAPMQCVGDAGVAIEISTGNVVTLVSTLNTADLRAVTGTLNGLRFYCGGEAGTVLVRDAGAATWSFMDKGIGQMMEIYGAWKPLRAASVTLDSTPEPVYFVGDLGRVVRLSGSIFTMMPATQIPQTLYAMAGLTELGLVAMGDDGEIIRYSSTGENGALLGTISR